LKYRIDTDTSSRIPNVRPWLDFPGSDFRHSKNASSALRRREGNNNQHLRARGT
jgi:hypothetical protein